MQVQGGLTVTNVIVEVNGSSGIVHANPVGPLDPTWPYSLLRLETTPGGSPGSCLQYPPSNWTLTNTAAGGTASGFDEWPIVLAGNTSLLTYPGSGCLHMWIYFATSPSPPEFVVDAAKDGSPFNYGYSVRMTSGSWFSELGTCPVIGFLPYASATQPLQPVLRLTSEPWLGQPYCLQLINAAPSSAGLLLFGSWLPGTGLCALHLDQQSLAWVVLATDSAGMASYRVDVPTNPAYLFLTLGYQAWSLPPSGPFSNALRLTIGGGL